VFLKIYFLKLSFFFEVFLDCFDVKNKNNIIILIYLFNLEYEVGMG
jgi:hypothetical protein